MLFPSYIFPRLLGETTKTLVQSAFLGVHKGSRGEHKSGRLTMLEFMAPRSEV